MRRMTRREVLRSGLGGFLALPWLSCLKARAEPIGLTDAEIVLGVSAAFSGPSRGLGIELYRGANAYFEHINQAGGIRGRKVVLKTYDDGYQPNPAVTNTMTLVLEDQVFALFGYVGTPTVTRVLPVLKKFQERKFYLFFPFTGAQPQREPPYGDFAFNLRASYGQETAGLVDNFVSIGKRGIAVFYQADAYGRSGWGRCATGHESTWRTNCGRSDLSAGREILRQHASAGGDTAEIESKRRHLHRFPMPPVPHFCATPSTSGCKFRSPISPSSEARTC